ncbi:MAG: hypothetical protein WEA58_11605 [Balneolaceae bacterium]
MKSTKRIVLVLLLMLLIPISVLLAQDDGLNQDIRIGEKILSELISENENDFLFQTGQSPMVRGEYIPDYGVHFVLGTGVSSRSIIARVFSQMENDDKSESPEDIGERVEKIMRDYLQNYAVVSRHLADDEHVRLTYNSQNSVTSVTIRPNSRSEKRLTVPSISMWATAADLKNQRNGSISDDELQRRITVQNISNDDIGNDLKVFSSVLKTSLDNAETEHLRAGRDVRFDYIPDLGVHYHVNITTAGIFGMADLQGVGRRIDELDLGISDIDINFGEIEFDTTDQMRFHAPEIEFKMDSSRIHIRNLNDSIRIDLEEVRKQAAEARKQGEIIRGQAETVRRQAEDIRKQFAFNVAARDTIDYSEDAEKIMDQLNQVVADYGQTLRSLSDGEQLMITVNWRGRNLPERTTLRITREDLLNGRSPAVTEY